MNAQLPQQPPARAPSLNRVLALDTSTDRMVLALGAAGDDEPVWRHESEGGAQASARLLPVIFEGLAAVGWTLAGLDAVVFGQGPGSFTGLRTACAVVQGLAFGARADGLPVVPVNTLLATAEDARWREAQAGKPCPESVVALLDARMDEMYAAVFTHTPNGRLDLTHPVESRLLAPEALETWLVHRSPETTQLVGNAASVYGHRFGAAATYPHTPARPTAEALLRLTPELWLRGAAVDAEHALPLYVRDKVAQTTEEREQAKALKAGALR